MKPNLLFVNSITIYGGGEVWMINTMSELIFRGYSVTLICKNEAEIISHATKAGIDVYPCRMSGDLDPFSISGIVKIMRRKKIDIALVNTSKDLRLCGIARWFSKRTKIIARQGIDYPLKNTFRYKLSYNKFADSIVANSEATKQTMLKNAPWLDEEKINIIYNGINPEIFSVESTRNLRSEFGFTDTDILLGFVGRLSVQKGIEYLLDAFLLLYEKYQNAHLLIVGDGELKDQVKRFSIEHNVEKNIHLLGFRNDIHDIMRTIDIFVLPSLWEGFGIVLIEAMASSKPCVASEISSIPEIVLENETGILVPPKKSKAIADALIKLISDPFLRKKFGENGQRIVKEKFTIDGMINKYENLFNELYSSK